MSERSNVDMADVLGDNYLVTSISASDYNPTIDGTVTLTVTVKDVYGDPISGEEVEVTCSGGSFTGLNGSTITSTSSVTGTTDANGQFTVTYTCTMWGIIGFSALNESKEIHVTGWKNIAGSSSGTWEILRNQDHAKLILRGWPTASSAGTSSWNNFGGSAYASSVRPTQYKSFANAGVTAYFRITASGSIEYRSASGTLAQGTEMWCEVEWAIRDSDL